MIELHCDGFLLRPLSKFDLEGYFATMRDPKTAESMNAVPATIDEARADIEKMLKKVDDGISEIFTIVVDGAYAGNIVLEHNDYDTTNDDGRLHIWVHPAFRGRGLATSALKTVIDYGLRTKYKRIFAQCKESNTAVMDVNKRLGFTMVNDPATNNALLLELRKEPRYAELKVPEGKALWVKTRPPSLFSRLGAWLRR